MRSANSSAPYRLELTKPSTPRLPGRSLRSANSTAPSLSGPLFFTYQLLTGPRYRSSPTKPPTPRLTFTPWTRRSYANHPLPVRRSSPTNFLRVHGTGQALRNRQLHGYPAEACEAQTPRLVNYSIVRGAVGAVRWWPRPGLEKPRGRARIGRATLSMPRNRRQAPPPPPGRGW